MGFSFKNHEGSKSKWGFGNFVGYTAYLVVNWWENGNCLGVFFCGVWWEAVSKTIMSFQLHQFFTLQ